MVASVVWGSRRPWVGKRGRNHAGAKRDEPLRAQVWRDWMGCCSEVNGLGNARAVPPIPTPTAKGVALAGADGNCWPQNCLVSLEIREEEEANSISHTSAQYRL